MVSRSNRGEHRPELIECEVRQKTSGTDRGKKILVRKEGREMKKLLSSTAPPTPTQKRQRKSEAAGAAASTNSSVSMTKSSGQADDRDLKFMEATFRVVGYQSREESGSDEDVVHVSSDGSVFQPNTRKILSQGKLNLVKFIEDNYSIPKDFETSTKFGPHSGLCFEDRLISCYEWKQFPAKSKFQKKDDTDSAWKLCWKCEEQGSHLAREGCPKEA